MLADNLVEHLGRLVLVVIMEPLGSNILSFRVLVVRAVRVVLHLVAALVVLAVLRGQSGNQVLGQVAPAVAVALHPRCMVALELMEKYILAGLLNNRYWSTVNDFVDTDSSQCVQVNVSYAVNYGI